MGYGWEGLWFDSMSGQWGFDLSNPLIFYRYAIETTYDGRTYHTTTASAQTAQEIAFGWGEVIATTQGERWSIVLRAIGAAGFPETGVQGQLQEFTINNGPIQPAFWHNGHWNFPLSQAVARSFGLVPGRWGTFWGVHYTGSFFHQDVANPLAGPFYLLSVLHLFVDMIGGGVFHVSLDRWPRP
jgi:hypothetical protein